MFFSELFGSSLFALETDTVAPPDPWQRAGEQTPIPMLYFQVYFHQLKRKKSNMETMQNNPPSLQNRPFLFHFRLFHKQNSHPPNPAFNVQKSQNEVMQKKIQKKIKLGWGAQEEEIRLWSGELGKTSGQNEETMGLTLRGGRWGLTARRHASEQTMGKQAWGWSRGENKAKETVTHIVATATEHPSHPSRRRATGRRRR